MENKVTFRTYCGKAGSLVHLLIAETNDGYKETVLVHRTGWFQSFFMNFAKRQLKRRLLIKTGRNYVE